MERALKPSKTSLPLAALIVTIVAVAWLVLIAPALEAIVLPAPSGATEAQAMEVWEQLSAAIQRDDREEAKRLATWLDERLEAQGKVLPVPYSRIVQMWCEMAGHGYEFCEEAIIDDP